jgi:hypothetical protein
MDDLIVHDPELGKTEFWKVLAWHTAKLRNAVARADSAALDTAPPDQLPPKVVADQQPKPAIDPDLLKAIEAKVDELTARLDAFEHLKKAEDALLDLEERVDAEIAEREQRGDDMCDDGDLLLKHEGRDDGDLLVKHMGDDGRTLN